MVPIGTNIVDVRTKDQRSVAREDAMKTDAGILYQTYVDNVLAIFNHLINQIELP